MSTPELPHGWPDGETRPLPFGQVLEHGSVTLGGSGVLTLTDIEVGAWPTLAITLASDVESNLIGIDWEYLDGAPGASPRRILYHHGNYETLLVPNLAHRITQLAIEAPAGTAITYTIVGCNQNPAAVYTSPMPRLVRVADPAAGATSVDVYQVPAGSRATLLGLSLNVFLEPRDVPYPLSGSVAETVAGVDVVIRDFNDVVFWRQTLWSNQVPFTFAGHGGVADPAQYTFIGATTGANTNNEFLFESRQGLDNTLGEPSTAFVIMTAVPLVAPLWLPQLCTVALSEWTADAGGSFQNPNGSDPRLQTSRQAPYVTDQLSNIALLVGEE